MRLLNKISIWIICVLLIAGLASCPPNEVSDGGSGDFQPGDATVDAGDHLGPETGPGDTRFTLA